MCGEGGIWCRAIGVCSMTKPELLAQLVAGGDALVHAVGACRGCMPWQPAGVYRVC